MTLVRALLSIKDDLVVVVVFRSNEADGNENVKIAIGFISKTTTLHVYHDCLNISLPVSFSSPEPLGLICNRPRGQETTGSGDENVPVYARYDVNMRVLWGT